MSAVLEYSLITIAFILVELAVLARILLRPNRDPASRLAWLFVVGVFPLFGIFVYLLFGEVSIGRRRVARRRAVLARLQKIQAGGTETIVLERHSDLFRLGQSISGFQPVGGNTARLLADLQCDDRSDRGRHRCGKEHVHLLFYIWLPDNNGCKVIEALKRRARGITCRAMADDLGVAHADPLRSLAGHAPGRRLANGLPVGNPCCGPSWDASTFAITARSSSSMVALPTAAAKTVLIRNFW